MPTFYDILYLLKLLFTALNLIYAKQSKETRGLENLKRQKYNHSNFLWDEIGCQRHCFWAHLKAQLIFLHSPLIWTLICYWLIRQCSTCTTWIHIDAKDFGKTFYEYRAFNFVVKMLIYLSECFWNPMGWGIN